MGFNPRTIGRMRLWEFDALLRGYMRANGGGDDAPGHDAFLDALAREKAKTG